MVLREQAAPASAEVMRLGQDSLLHPPLQMIRGDFSSSDCDVKIAIASQPAWSWSLAFAETLVGPALPQHQRLGGGLSSNLNGKVRRAWRARMQPLQVPDSLKASRSALIALEATRQAGQQDRVG